MKYQEAVPGLMLAAFVIGLLYFGDERVTVAADLSWPQFRGPHGSGVADETGVPVEFGGRKNVLWKTLVPEGHSSPIVWNDRIFLTAFDEGRLEAICLDRKTGIILWRRTAGERRNLSKGHGTNTRASPTPATDGERVYVYFGPLGLVAYDLDGNEQWRVSLPKVMQPWGVGTSPVVAGDRVLLNVDDDVGSFLLAIDAATGNEIWKVERPEFRRGYSTPLVLTDDNQVVVSGSLRLVAYDLEAGRDVWTVDGLPYQVSPSPVFADGTIYMAAWDVGFAAANFDGYLVRYDKNKDNRITSEEYGFNGEHPKYDRDKDGFVTRKEFDGLAGIISRSKPALLAIRPGGKGNVTESHVRWRSSTSLPHIPSVLVYRGLVYTIRNGGIVTCYDAESGKTHYRARLPATGSYYASPVATDGKVYFASKNGVVVVVEAGAKMKVVATNNIGEQIMASPAIVDNTVYLRTENHLYAFFAGAQFTDKLVSELNRHRDSLDAVFRHDLANNQPTKERLRPWGQPSSLTPEADGLRMVAKGTNKPLTAGLSPEVSLEGDFDVAVGLDVLKLDRPDSGQLSAVYLYIGFDADSKPAASLMFVCRPDGSKEAHVRVQSRNGDGKTVYRRVATVHVESVSGLRIARRGQRLAFLFKDSQSEPYRVLAQTDASVKAVPKGFIRLLVRTGGADRETVALWKELDIRAEETGG